MLFEAPGYEKYLSAAILDRETLYHGQRNNCRLLEVLKKKGIVPGFKPHLKVYTLPGTNGDTVMQGLDDSLAVRCPHVLSSGNRPRSWERYRKRQTHCQQEEQSVLELVNQLLSFLDSRRWAGCKRSSCFRTSIPVPHKVLELPHFCKRFGVACHDHHSLELL